MDNLRNYTSHSTDLLTNVFCVSAIFFIVCNVTNNGVNIASILLLSLFLSVWMPLKLSGLTIGPTCFDVQSFLEIDLLYALSEDITLSSSNNKFQGPTLSDFVQGPTLSDSVQGPTLSDSVQGPTLSDHLYCIEKLGQ